MELLWHQTPIIKENADLEGYVLENIEFTSSLKSYFINSKYSSSRYFVSCIVGSKNSKNCLCYYIILYYISFHFHISVLNKELKNGKIPQTFETAYQKDNLLRLLYTNKQMGKSFFWTT